MDVLNGPAWRAAWAALPPLWRDVYFTPEYHALHEANGDGASYCGKSEMGGSSLLVPGIRSDIPGAPGAWDLQSCNGYGGPVPGDMTAASEREVLWTEWRSAAAAAGCVAAYFRLHPLLDNADWLPAAATVQVDRVTVFVDLTDGIDAVWRRADARHRNMVNRGRREGVSVIWDSPDAWTALESLYGEMMIRVGGQERLRFSPAYFARLRGLDGARVAGAYSGGRLEAVACFLFGEVWAHYHLAVRRAGAPNYASNCLLQSAFAVAAEQGLQGVHLGGGRTPDDSDELLRFKKSSGGELRAFKVARVIADDRAFAQLCRAWRDRTGRAPQWLLGYREGERPTPAGRGPSAS